MKTYGTANEAHKAAIASGRPARFTSEDGTVRTIDDEGDVRAMKPKATATKDSTVACEFCDDDQGSSVPDPCRSPVRWSSDIGGGSLYWCDRHKRELASMPENAGVEFFRVRATGVVR